jgi:GTP-binding protein Era
MDVLSQKIFEFLPQGPKLFPDDYLTDKPQRFFISETIRKYVLEFTREEIPHSVAVLIDDMKTDPPRTRGPADAGKNITHIQATIFVERPSQKAIVIGKKGQMLKGVGEAARKDIEKQLGTKVFLQLWVKVYKNWRQDPRAVKMLGYSQ